MPAERSSPCAVPIGFLQRMVQRGGRLSMAAVAATAIALLVSATITPGPAASSSSSAAATIVPASEQRADGDGQPTITLWGGAGEVAGSMGILEYKDTRWMIDCGMYYPGGEGTAEQREQRADERNTQIEVDPAEIDAVLLTHAHLDHIGRVPLLVARGYRGPIYLTTATGTLAAPMLDSQIRLDRNSVRDWAYSGRARSDSNARSIAVHWRAECQWNQQIAGHNRRTFRGSLTELRAHAGQPDRDPPLGVSVCRTCSGIELETVLRLFVPIEFGQAVELAHGVEVALQSAGHIPGASSFVFTLFQGAEQRARRSPAAAPQHQQHQQRPRPVRQPERRTPIWRVVFSGDLGNAMSPIVALPDPSPPADAAIVETTYGSNTRASDHEAERRRFREQVAAVVARDGIVLIPAFALDRTQKILYEMTLAKREGLIARNVPILCPSPSATNFNELYRRSQRDRWFPPEVARDREAFSPQGLIEGSRAADMVREHAERELPRPCVIITTSGMLTDAFGRTLLPILGPDERNAIFLVGYQEASTPGGQLRAGERLLEVNEEDEGGRRGSAPDLLRVKAEVQSFGVFSGHGDARELSDWMDSLRRDALVLLNHGELDALQARAEQLRAEGFTNVHVPKGGEPMTVPVITRAPQSAR